MRITCPDCQATYEVGEADIPEEGIEVECSACLNRWMQMPAGAVAEAEPVADTVPEASLPEPEPPAPAPSPPEAVIMDFPSASAPSAPPTEAQIPEPAIEPEPEIEQSADSDIDAGLPPAAGWRVPRPPTKEFLTQDPLDEILAEVDPAFQAPSVEQEPASAPSAAEPEDLSRAGPQADAPVLAEEPMPEAEQVVDIKEEAEPGPTTVETPVSAPSAPSMPMPEASVPSAPATAASVPEEPGILAASPPSRPSVPDMPEEQETPQPVVETEPVADLPEPVAEMDGDAESLNEPVIEEDLEEVVVPPAEEDGSGLGPVAKSLAEKALLAKVAAKPVAHWSQGIQPDPEPPAPTAPSKQGVKAQAKEGMEDLIRTLSASMPSRPSAPSAPNEADEEEVFHPWEGEAAPVVADAAPVEERADKAVDMAAEVKPAVTPASPADEDDDFDWEEAAEPESLVVPAFDPEPAQDSIEATHMAAIQAQKDVDLRPTLPEASNVIQADIPQVPHATMPSQRTRPGASAPTPSKPTPVESQEDVEAAIRAQFKNMAKPKSQSEPARSGIFGRRKAQEEARPAPQAAKPAPPANPLKEALLDQDDARPAGSGRRRGFFLVIYLFLAALALYIFGESLSAVIPALEPYISGYLGMVDQLRAITGRLLGG